MAKSKKNADAAAETPAADATPEAKREAKTRNAARGTAGKKGKDDTPEFQREYRERTGRSDETPMSYQR